MRAQEVCVLIDLPQGLDEDVLCREVVVLLALSYRHGERRTVALEALEDLAYGLTPRQLACLEVGQGRFTHRLSDRAGGHAAERADALGVEIDVAQHHRGLLV